MKHIFKLPALGVTDAEFNRMPFGSQIGFLREIHAWQAAAEVVHISQKGRSLASALREFRALYSPSAYYLVDRTSETYRDDSIPVHYTP